MSALSDFAAKFPPKRFDKGQVILMQDEAPTHLYAIKSGYVKAYDINPDGFEQLVWFGAKGRLFPLPWAFSVEDTNQFFYAAITDTVLHVIGREEFTEFLTSNPDVSFDMNRRLALWYNDLLRRLNASEKPNAREKLVYTLKFLLERFGDHSRPHKPRITIPLTHQDLANLLGLTRETVSIELSKLRDEGYIAYNKRSFAVNRDKLEELL